jgi:hypothetical protein
MVVKYVALLTSEKMDHQVFKFVTQVAMLTEQILTMIVQYAIRLTNEKYGPTSIQICNTSNQYVVHLTSEKHEPSNIQTCGTSSHGNKTSIKAQLSIPNHQIQVSNLHPKSE